MEIIQNSYGHFGHPVCCTYVYNCFTERFKITKVVIALILWRPRAALSFTLDSLPLISHNQHLIVYTLLKWYKKLIPSASYIILTNFR